MTIKNLFSLFSQGINWNAFFYGIYKATATATTFLLFKFLTSNDFSLWANINSIIFLVLLWLDFGLRKSIPRYCPEFAKDKTAQHRFVKMLLYFQASVLLIAAPILGIMMSNITASAQFHHYQSFIYIGIIVFIIEGVISLLRLIYHAHFWIKQFNILTTVALLAEVSANIILIFTQTESGSILKGIFVTKIISGIFVNSVGIFLLPRLYRDRNYPGNETIDYYQTLHQFIKHSAVMWMNNNLKSLSERNFLVPFFTITLGAPIANLFKVANDGALFFYRIVLKSIGTTDTALLSHVNGMKDEQKLMPIAFQKLMSKIAALCFPLLGILVILLLKGNLFFDNPFVFQTFFIMTIGYLIELIASPYERMLEIKRRYGLLLIAYSPYIVMIGGLFISNIISYIGLINSLIIIHGVRLLSSFIMVYLARVQYLLLFPIRYILTLVYIYTPLTLLLYLLLSWYPTIIGCISI